MRITPLDVRKQEFRKAVRGLDADEVHAFLATVADEYEFVLTDNKKLRDKVIELDEKVGEYRNMEKTLRDTLLTAERVMTEARQNARKEADLILRDAQMKASQEVSGINGRVESLHQQIRELRGHRDSYVARLQSLSEAQIGLIESYRKDFETTDSRIERAMGGNIEPPAPRPASQPAPPAAAAGNDRSIPAWDHPATEELQGPASGMHAPVGSDDEWRGYAVGDEERRSAPHAPVRGPLAEPGRRPASEALAPPVVAPRFEPPQFEEPADPGYPLEEEARYEEELSAAEYDARVASVADAWSGSVPRVDTGHLPQGDAKAIDEVSAALGMFTERAGDLPEPAQLEGESTSLPAWAPTNELAPDAVRPEAVQHADGSPYPDADLNDGSGETGSAEHEDSEGSRWSLSRIARGITGS